LGNIYLATGDLKKAETNYALAFDLFSSPENEKTLKAIRRTVEVNRRKLKQH
jgi:antitoxin component of RelBE/YafQ-DinJ toxin-antitoxin module